MVVGEIFQRHRVNRHFDIGSQICSSETIESILSKGGIGNAIFMTSLEGRVPVLGF